ncbi:MAG: hypothetical protein ACKVP7_02770 [Hyphomicrobiaceae bacterium]
MACSARGLMMGNRGGQLHDTARQLRRRRWVSKQWICCKLAFNGRQREVMAPHRYTELFFLDEATALAAGHRPCFECRRQEFLWFATLWAAARGQSGRAAAPDMDEVLQAERVDAGGNKVIWQAPAETLPSGTFVRFDESPHLVLAGWLLAWTPEGYTATVARPEGVLLDVLTPRAIVAVLSAGYCPMLHPSAEVVG